jgi:hypothetical protein
MKTSALQALGQKLKQQTGLDFAAYRNQALFDTLAEVLIFPRYAAKLVLLPVAGLLAAMLGLAGYFYWQAQPGLSVLTLGLGGLAALVNGLLWGILRFIRQLAQDLGQIGQLTAATSGQILTDLQKMADQPNLVQLPKVSEVALGTVHLVIMPGVVKAIARKVPLVGGLVSRVVQSVVGAVAGQVAARLDDGQGKVELALSQQVAQRTQTLRQYSETGIEQINRAVSSSSSFSTKALNLAALPVRVALWVVAPFSSLILGLIWWLG